MIITSKQLKIALSWTAVVLMTAVIYLTLPYGPLLREKIYKSFQPKIIETYTIQNSSFQVKEKNNALYSAEGKNGLGIYDISRPDSVTIIHRIEAEDEIRFFIESRKILYLNDGHAGLRIFDLKKPSAPQELSRVNSGKKISDFDIYENFLYVISDMEGLAIFDISEKKQPLPIQQLQISGICRTIKRHGNSAIIGTVEKGICLLDITDISEPDILGYYPTAGPVSSILAKENLLFAACSGHGLTIYDITDIRNPSKKSDFSIRTNLNGLRHRNGYLLLGGKEGGLIIINANRPEKPEIVRTFSTGYPVTGIYTRYYFAYAADTSPAVHYIDIDTGRYFVIYFVGATIFIILLLLVLYLIRTRAKHTLFNYLSILIIGLTYAYFLNNMRESPIEALHFLEYGFLSILVYRAFRYHLNDKLIFFISAALITVIGMGDEFIQWQLPNRHWDFRDVGFNALSGGLIQLAIWLGIGPELLKTKIAKKSVILLKNYLLLLLLLFSILLSLTPQLNSRLAGRFPFLQFLDNPEPISEYGYKIFHSDIGGFFSRYEESELQQYDKTYGALAGKILDENFRTNYGQFLNQYTSGREPFIHELRVHLFRRDRYYQDKRYWVAYKENLILENFFSNSLNASKYKWRDGQARICSEQIGDQAKDFYVSPVSWQIITSFNVKTVWLCFIFINVIFLVLYFSIRRKYFS